MKDRMADMWGGLRDKAAGVADAARARPKVAGGIGVATVAVLAVVGVVALTGSDSEESDDRQIDTALVAVNDIPAVWFVGWDRTAVDAMPSVSQPDSSVVSPGGEECRPGGDRQQAVQKMVYAGDEWAGEQFTNYGIGQKITVDLSTSKNNDVGQLDSWLADCTDTPLVIGGTESVMVLSSLPVNPEFYGLEEARVYAVTVGEGDLAASTLTAYGLNDGVTAQVTLTLRGEVTDAAIEQLDAVWRAQTAKLVGMQEAGQL